MCPFQAVDLEYGFVNSQSDPPRGTTHVIWPGVHQMTRVVKSSLPAACSANKGCNIQVQAIVNTGEDHDNTQMDD